MVMREKGKATDHHCSFLLTFVLLPEGRVVSGGKPGGLGVCRLS